MDPCLYSEKWSAGILEGNIIVRMNDITMSFMGNKVLEKANFELREGEVHALMGANGAGKSTLIKILNGIYLPVSGTIEINGNPVAIKSPKNVEKYGLAFVHQELNICNDMSIAENMYIGNWATKLGLYDKKSTSEKARELLRMMDIDLDPATMVRRLRTAEKQIIEILKALTRDARVIVLDEPTSSLNEKEKEKFFSIVARLKAKGVSIIFISHFLEDVIRISDRVTVLKDGVNNGLFENAHYGKDDLIKAMMGRKIKSEHIVKGKVKSNASIALELKNLSSNKKFQDINFQIMEGDIVGVCGLLGAGKTEIARSIFGLDNFDSGNIVLFGEKITRPYPDKMIERGVVLLTEERKLEGFIPLMSIRENTTLSIMNTLRNKLGFLDRQAQENFARRQAEQMSIKMSGIEQPVVSLSGGNQQKVVMAKCMANKPKLFLLDEPTRGVDVYAKSEIYKYLRQAAEDGTTVLIFSSELEELLENCSKIIILKKGHVTGLVNTVETSKSELLELLS
jgi:ABC-type sugar transport system ATPase subunit